ncbi:MAG: Flp pilus assembly protein CpaB [Sinobacteraceae bacterium]|nr:Flp pilus assembly protein CpaB [Nevskiaceae bacterium]
MLSRLKYSSTWLLVLLAVAAGATAFWSTQRFLDDNAAGVRRQWEARYALKPVLVAARDLTAGQMLQSADLARREMPAGFLPSGTFDAADAERVFGQRLGVALRAGDPLGESSLEARLPALSQRLPDGSRAVTVPVDQVSSQAGLVRPGDRVDLMLAEERLEGMDRCVVVRSLLESVQVLATGQATRDALSPGEGLPDLGAQYSTITLDVTPEQAQQLAVGLRMGELIPMLRGAEDDAPTGLDTLGDGRLACRGLVRDDGSAAASARRRLPVDVMVGGRPPARFARVWVSDSDI